MRKMMRRAATVGVFALVFCDVDDVGAGNRARAGTIARADGQTLVVKSREVLN